MYDECRQRVWAYAVSRVGRQDADEVVAETFTIAWRRLADVPEPPLPWLLGVARNVLRAGHRAEARRAAFAAELGRWTAAENPGGDIAEDVTDRLAVLRAMAALPEGDQEILVLIAWQGLSPRDAARVVGCSPAALRVRLHRARRRLVRAAEETHDTPRERPERATGTRPQGHPTMPAGSPASAHNAPHGQHAGTPAGTRDMPHGQRTMPAGAAEGAYEAPQGRRARAAGANGTPAGARVGIVGKEMS
ncbi:sigma-70 family RNA polymerase sigma factor [Actinomadura decatromicini]|uniref:Sigma-70 family RNA polymerase sigma factor n=1 Tax=Actinomadura decatromicini TaxID=2604572 RepID=A0A5D3FH88_9ACTN|nr:sigma-70 family RNA polymerase sigma factor [Actinomadura decatromicini]